MPGACRPPQCGRIRRPAPVRLALGFRNLRNDTVNHPEFIVHPVDHFRSPLFRAEIAAHHIQCLGDIVHILHGDTKHRDVDPLYRFHRFVVIGAVNENGWVEGSQCLQIHSATANGAGLTQSGIRFLPEIGLYIDSQNPVTKAQSLNKGNGYRVDRGNGSLFRLSGDIQDPSRAVKNLIGTQGCFRGTIRPAGRQRPPGPPDRAGCPDRGLLRLLEQLILDQTDGVQ